MDNSKKIDANGYGFVDLELPSGTLWATQNVGASKPSDCGLYFQWGSVDGNPYPSTRDITGTFVYNNINVDWTIKQKNRQIEYSWSTAPYCTNSDPKFLKYVGSTESSYKDPSATDEDALKTTLDEIDDAAVQRLGNGKRMPTTEEFLKLKTHTYWQWIGSGTNVVVKVVNNDGTVTSETIQYPAGYFVFRTKNDSHKGQHDVADISTHYDYNYNPAVGSSPEKEADVHIFLPASGYIYDAGLGNRGSSACYLSSSFNTSYPELINDIFFNKGGIDPQNNNSRLFGYCVRAVSEN